MKINYSLSSNASIFATLQKMKLTIKLMIKLLYKFLRKSLFITTPFSIIINPYFIIRHGLYHAISQVAPLVSGDVLDFGCGSKPYQSLFINSTSYTGLDLLSAKNDYINSEADVYYDGTIIPFTDDKFDSLVSFEVIDDLMETNEIFREFHRVLKPNGVVLITSPFGWEEHDMPNDYARYTEFGIRHLLESHNFQIIQHIKSTNHFLAVSQIFLAYLYLHVFTKKLKINKLAQILFIFPLTLMAICIDIIMPKSFSFYGNNIILARKSTPK